MRKIEPLDRKELIQKGLGMDTSELVGFFFGNIIYKLNEVIRTVNTITQNKKGNDL